ncbi:Hpt domain-containing protein, partial [Pseudomonas sp. K13]
MSFGADEEILQDFLVEAGEILEQLSEQLVELESRPDDADLLNAIFRGFHTVKGGAGFLQLNELVECCHIAENVFDILRKGERRVDAELMDVVLEALDTVNSMFGQVRERSEITPATPELLAALARLAEPAGEDVAAPAVVEAPAAVEPPAASEDITDTEFEQLLDSLDAVKAQAEAAEQAPVEAASGNADEITDAEFESLLDQLHGKGQFSPDVAESDTPAAVSPASDEITDSEFEALLDQLHGKGTFAADGLPKAEAAAGAPAAEPAGEHITDHEFEALLDQLHGKGKFSGDAVAAEAPAAATAVAPTPAAKAESKPVAKPAPAAAAKPAA